MKIETNFVEKLKQEISRLGRIVDIEDVFDVIDQVSGINNTKESNYSNTEITYFYRDEANSKTWFSYVLKGLISEEQKQTIFNCLQDKYFGFFNPKLVGLPDGDLVREEGDWFELLENSILPTNASPTFPIITVDELVKAFQKAKEQNWSWNYLEEDHYHEI